MSRTERATSSAPLFFGGLTRFVSLTLLAGAALVMRSSESEPGNRLFLLVLAVLLAVIAVWGLWQSYTAIRARRRSGR